MTERGRGALTRDAASLTIGPSAVEWDGTALTLSLDEVAVPLPGRIRGTVRVIPEAVTDGRLTLDPAGRHRWWPIAPRARVEVALRAPDLAWQGDGYLDTNDGDEPLQAGFRSWTWSRAPLADGAAVLYDVVGHDGPGAPLALRFDRAGGVERAEPPPPATLPTTRIWRVPRSTRADPGGAARVAETLEDSPFYARSVVETTVFGESAKAVHESLSLTRFATPWVKVLLPFRMPRRG
ncbi:MAG: carotenoid 1,2-hydratase [Azospirillaceae bacterium]